MRAGEKAHAVFGPAPSAAVAAVVLALCACTIVRDEPAAKEGGSAAGTSEATAATGSSTAPSGFDAGRMVDGMWDQKVLPFFSEKAADVTQVLPAIAQDLDAAGQKYGHRPDEEGSPWSFAVKGQGKVVETHTESRAGTMIVAVGQGTQATRVTLQIGPVVRGSAIRDSLPFLAFGDVKNQIEFAQLGRAMNDHALKALQPTLAALKPGATVSFAGATSVTSAGEDVLVTPVTLVEGAR